MQCDGSVAIWFIVLSPSGRGTTDNMDSVESVILCSPNSFIRLIESAV